jgi:hypothetical protein
MLLTVNENPASGDQFTLLGLFLGRGLRYRFCNRTSARLFGT